MGRINRLDRSVYNRISAGEVVENPASVVKELVENAIDAGATEITVSIEYGGIKRISVVDNGCGMEEDDLELAVLPHATSKIYTAEDLETVSTLGFRGEALASITAVSKTTIRSKYAESEDQASYIDVEGGEITESGKCNLQKGTTIEVNSLFYNTPARFRFLKTPKGEESQVTRLMGELILANPEIAFSYEVDGEIVYNATGEGLESAVSTVFGAEVHDCMVGFYISEKGYTVKGFAARAASAGIKGNKNNEIFIVNGRSISDTTMQAVIANAYGERLMRRTYPSIVVDIVMPFADVDVNVHPNKREVRFADGKLLYGLVYNAIKAGLEEDEKYQKETIAAMLAGKEEQKVFFHSDMPSETDDELEKTREELRREYYKNFPSENEYEGEKSYVEPPKSPIITPFDALAEGEDRPYERPNNFFSWTEQDGFTRGDFTKPPVLYFSDSQADDKAEQEETSYKVVGQFFDTYILVEIGEKILIIDQHAAHERMLFDKFSEEIKNKVLVQELLFPIEANVSSEQAAFFSAHTADFEKLGFELSVENEKVIVKSIPVVLTDLDVPAFIADVGTEKEIKSVSDVSVFRDKLAQKACKSAIKGGDRLNSDQVEYFIREYAKNGTPIQCPHGRPTLIALSKREIEKMFGRIV